MRDLQVLLYELKKPHCILPEYAAALENKLTAYLDGTMTLGDMPNEDMPMSQSMDNAPMDKGVAVIDINGILMKRVGLPQDMLDLFGIVDLDTIDAQLREAIEDPAITAVVLNVNSPGGFLSGVRTTAALVNQLSQVKETVVFSNLLNASAAYWISSAASSIIGDGEFGSIGVYMTIEDWSKAYDNAGIKANLIKAGTYKAIGLDSQPLTDEQRAYLQSEINTTWEQFKSAVTTKRSIKEEDMQGQTFSGQTAMDKGFVDGMATSLSDVIAILSADTTK